MRIENTDRFRNKECKVVFKDNHCECGTIFFIPNHSAKYNFHDVGWFLKDFSREVKLNFKDILSIDIIDEILKGR